MPSGLELSPAQRRALAAVCDTFVPALSDDDTAQIVRQHLATLASRSDYQCQAALEQASAEAVAFCRRSASEAGALESCEEALRDHLPPDVASGVGWLLSALASRVGMLALCGVSTPFADLDPAAREAALHGLGGSMLAEKRKAFQALRALACFKAFGGTAAGQRAQGSGGRGSPNWAAIGYSGPEPHERVQAALEAAGGRPEHHFRLLNAELSSNAILDFDAVVVGSGCGGAVVAAELAAAGRRVLVLEKGTYFPRSEFSGVEGDAFNRLYERGGLMVTEDTGLMVLAGSTFGGGSTVNWACSLRTPEHVRREWADEHGLPRLGSEEFGASLDAVCERIGVTGSGVAHNRNNQLLIEGCERCGYSIETAPQNLADVSAVAPGANFICLGDRYGIKQSMTETYLRDAATASVPAQFVDRCLVRRVLHRDGVAGGVEAEVVGAGGRPCRLEVRAPTVVVSCGAVGSPALLLRSRLPNRNGRIGKNLRLHPVSFVVGRVAAGAPDVAMWEGAPMTAVSTECVAGPVGDNYGCRLECPSVHPGLGASVMPWLGGRQFKEVMLGLRRFTSQIILVRDRGSGEVRIDKQGTPRLYYPLGHHDRQSMLDGLERAIRATAAAGVDEITTSQAQVLGGLRTLPPVSMPEARAAAVEALVAEVRKAGFPLFKAGIYSAHQMGTCKMGASPKDSVVDGDGQCWEISGLYVADASVFPTSSGTNPMVTTLALAHFIAQQLKRKLRPQSRL